MNRTFNQILNKAIKRGIWHRKAMLLLTTCYLLLAAHCLYAVNLDTIQMTCRPNFGPPTNITDLEAFTGTNVGEVDFFWTEPAEDQPLTYGTLILPYPYRLGYSTKPITDFPLANNTTNWWAQALKYDPNELPTPVGYNNPRADTIQLPGYAGEVVYFAMRVQDSGYLWSHDFNISSATVRYDVVSPAAISDLTALAGKYEGQVNLQWTSPGDDGIVGNIVNGLYWIKYSSVSIINNSHYGPFTPPFKYYELSIATSTTPGDKQSYTIDGLQNGTTYWFAIWTRDEIDSVNNWSVWNSTADDPTVNIRASTMSAVDDDPPASVALSTGSVGFTSVELNWLAPTENVGRSDGITSGQYWIKYTTDPVIVAFNDWNAVPSQNQRIISTSNVSVGIAQAYTVTGLNNNTTYWFSLKTGDEIPNWSANSNWHYTKTLDATPPAPVSNFAAVPLYAPNGREIRLTWNNPMDTDLEGVLIIYSTGTPSAFVPVDGTPIKIGDYNGYIISTGPATLLIHSNLIPFAKYYYTAYTYDFRPNYSVQSSTTAIAPPAADTVPPREPRGLKVASSDRNYLTISWTAVTKSTDGTTATDLSHYTLHCSNSITGTDEEWTLPLKVTSTTTYTGGNVYYYWLTCHDLSTNISEPSARVSSPDMNIAFCESNDDPKTSISIPPSISSILYKETNSFGDNIYFDIVRLKSEETGKTYRSFAFLPKKADSEEVVTGLLFSRALADVKISYDVSGGYVGAPHLAPIPANQAADNLALFWFNGVEWVKVGGDVDTTQQTVSLKTKKGGKYQLRQSMSSLRFALTKVYPRIFSPNGDGWNDVANFMYEGNDSGITGKVFDINGAFVSDMARGDTEDSLKWDGKNSDGKVVSSGIYIYQLEADKKVFNGTVVVAK